MMWACCCFFGSRVPLDPPAAGLLEYDGEGGGEGGEGGDNNYQCVLQREPWDCAASPAHTETDVQHRHIHTLYTL